MNNNSISEVFGIFNKLAPQQKIILGIVTAVTIILMIILFTMLNQPKYATLYTNLNQEDAAKVLEELSNQKIAYTIENGGRTIKVPQETVYETRLQMASKGIPSTGVVGYEIFDKNTLGMSEFMQRLNYKRALEGELARTIMRQEGIDGVRVHIVLPEKTVFKQDQKPPTASVVLKLRNGFMMDKQSILAIQNLLSSSVEGLKQGHVSLIDTEGRLLSKNTEENDIGVATTKQYELKQSIENYLSQKAQKLLDNVLGYGNSMIQVDAELDFNQVEKTMESYDPETQIAISEQTIKTENASRNMVDSTGQITENSTINYEISKTIERVIQGSGTIKKLTVAAVINEVPKEVQNGEQTEIVYEPRSQEQLKKLEDIVKNTVGYNVRREDNFSLVSIPFETKPNTNLDTGEQTEEPFFDFKDIDKLTNIVLILAAVIASLLILRSLMSKLKNEKILIGTVNGGSLALSGGGSGAEGESYTAQGQAALPKKRNNMLPLGDLEDEISDEAVLKKNQQDKISNYVSKNPMDAAKLINSWLHEDELN